MTVAIVYLPDQSRFTPRVDQFMRTGEKWDNRLVWQGRELSIEEFNAQYPKINEHSRTKWGVEPRVELVEVAPVAASKAKPKKKKPAPVKTKAAQQPAKPKPEKKAPVVPVAHTVA